MMGSAGLQPGRITDLCMNGLQAWARAKARDLEVFAGLKPGAAASGA